MRLGLVLALRAGVRQRVRQTDGLQRVHVVAVVEVHGVGAHPGARGDDGSVEQARPVEGPRQLHAAGAVTREGAVSSSSGFPDTLDGLCTGHLSVGLHQIWKT